MKEADGSSRSSFQKSESEVGVGLYKPGYQYGEKGGFQKIFKNYFLK